MRKIYLKFIILAVSFLLPLAANATREVGNGGTGVYCKNEKDPKKRVQLFDLYEGSVLLKIVPLESPLEFKDYALGFSAYLDNMIGGPTSFHDRIQYIINSIQFVEAGQGLVSTDDLDNFIYPKNCDLVQILNYKDGRVWVDGDYWNQLSNINQAAAILHEAIYAYAREQDESSSAADGDFNSARTRQIVALLMAGRKIDKVDDSLLQPLQAEVLKCTTPQAAYAGRATTEFTIYTYPGNSSTHITFGRLGGRVMLTNDSIDFTGSVYDRRVSSRVISLIDWTVRVELEIMDAFRQIQITITEGDSRIQEVARCEYVTKNLN